MIECRSKKTELIAGSVFSAVFLCGCLAIVFGLVDGVPMIDAVYIFIAFLMCMGITLFAYYKRFNIDEEGIKVQFFHTVQTYKYADIKKVVITSAKGATVYTDNDRFDLSYSMTHSKDAIEYLKQMAEKHGIEVNS